MGLIHCNEIDINYKTYEYRITEVAPNNGGLYYIVDRKEDDNWINLHENFTNSDDADNFIIDLELAKYRKYLEKKVNPIKDYFKNKITT